MTSPGDQRYQRAQDIAHAALDAPAGGRAAFLADACGDDTELRREVDWLIAAVEISGPDGRFEGADELARTLLADLRIEASAPRQYRLVERIGEGGMGQVWLAERDDAGIRRHVALKMLRAAGLPDRRELARFIAEGRILAALQHPNIAQLVDAGAGADGMPFLAMEYVDGERIDRWCDTRGLSLRERIALFLKVCSAIEYAHAQLVIHRDLKPPNILVGSNGEPKLLDFGIARLLEREAGPAPATTVLQAMTLAYASPEQIEGRALGTATDIYSLGVVLYELLAGMRPFDHLASDHARSTAIVSGEVAPPSRRLRDAKCAPAGAGARAVRTIPADIDAIVLKALRREPAQRYASVGELADDLRRYLAAQPVLARRGQFGYRSQRFLRRNRWPIAAAVLVAFLASGFTWRTVLAEREARVEAEVAGRTTEFLVSTFSLSDPTNAGRHDFSAREVLDQGRARIEAELADQPRVRARLLEALGHAYRGINEGEAGAPLFDEAARLNLDPAVADPLAASRNLRAKALAIGGARGSSAAAEQAATQALDLVREHAAGDEALLADAWSTLARALDASGKRPAAETAARQALALRERMRAPAPVIAESLLDLCDVSIGLGEAIAARPWCERALAAYGEAGMTRTNAYRIALDVYEDALAYGGDYAKSVAVARERLGLTRELFGEDSSALATERAAFARTLAERGQFEEAAGLLAAATPVILRRDGPRSTQHALAVFSAGWVHYLSGEFDAAVPRLREALELFQSTVGDGDNDRLPVLRVDLAMALIESGQAGAEARALLEAVVAARSAAHRDTSELAYARLPLARWLVANREYAQAGALLDQVEAVGDRIEPEMHARIASTRAQILRAHGDEAGALLQDRRAYELTLRDVGAANPRTARHAMVYARALRATGQVGQAEALERHAAPIIERAYPATSTFRRALPR